MSYKPDWGHTEKPSLKMLGVVVGGENLLYKTVVVSLTGMRGTEYSQCHYEVRLCLNFISLPVASSYNFAQHSLRPKPYTRNPPDRKELQETVGLIIFQTFQNQVPSPYFV